MPENKAGELIREMRMAMENMVISGSDVTFGLLEELFKQLKAGAKDPSKGLTGAHFRAFLEHRDPFDISELGKVLPYADEEIPSDYGYPKDFRIRRVAEQLKVLVEHFPGLDASYVEELAKGALPEGAEGWAVIPKPEKIGKAYHEALAKVINLLDKDRQFKNWREGALTEKHLRLKGKTAQVHAKLNEQPGDFWVISFQFGKKWAGHSVRNAQVRFAGNEVGLGPYEVGILIKTHPERITVSDQLYIDCAGCEYAPNADDGDFFACLRFRWYSVYERLELGYGRTNLVNGRWGAASGFLAQ